MRRKIIAILGDRKLWILAVGVMIMVFGTVFLGPIFLPDAKFSINDPTVVGEEYPVFGDTERVPYDYGFSESYLYIITYVSTGPPQYEKTEFQLIKSALNGVIEETYDLSVLDTIGNYFTLDVLTDDYVVITHRTEETTSGYELLVVSDDGITSMDVPAIENSTEIRFDLVPFGAMLYLIRYQDTSRISDSLCTMDILYLELGSSPSGFEQQESYSYDQTTNNTLHTCRSAAVFGLMLKDAYVFGYDTGELSKVVELSKSSISETEKFNGLLDRMEVVSQSYRDRNFYFQHQGFLPVRGQMHAIASVLPENGVPVGEDPERYRYLLFYDADREYARASWLELGYKRSNRFTPQLLSNNKLCSPFRTLITTSIANNLVGFLSHNLTAAIFTLYQPFNEEDNSITSYDLSSILNHSILTQDITSDGDAVYFPSFRGNEFLLFKFEIRPENLQARIDTWNRTFLHVGIPLLSTLLVILVYSILKYYKRNVDASLYPQQGET